MADDVVLIRDARRVIIGVRGVGKDSLVLNVKDYGAKGVGTDDTAAIQSALDAARLAGGACVYLPRGTYIISSYLRIGSKTSLRGEGWASILKLIDSAPNTASSDILHNYNLNNGFSTPLSTPSAPTITYLAGSGTLPAATYSYRVSANNAQGETLASTAATGVASAGSARMQVAWSAVTGATSYNVYGRTAGVEKLIAENVAASPYVDTGAVTPVGLVSDANYTATKATTQDTDISISDLTIDGNKANNAGLTAIAGGAYFNNVDGLSVKNVRVKNTTKHGITMSWCSDLSIGGNVVTGCGTAGSFTGLMFYMRNNGGTVSGNTISGCGFGILTDHYSSNLTVTGNNISGSTDSGIGFDEGSFSMTCTGNTITGCGLAGITVTDGQTGRRTHDITVSGNTCADNVGDGIVFAGTDYFTASGNTCVRNGVGIRTVAVEQPAKRGVITGNLCAQNGAQGMYLNAGSTNITVVGNRCGWNVSHGIELISVTRSSIKQNDCSNNNNANAGGFVCGIRLSGTCVDNVVVGNTCTNDVSTYGQHAGIYFSTLAAGSNTRYGGNVVFNNQSNQFFSDNPANDIALTY